VCRGECFRESKEMGRVIGCPEERFEKEGHRSLSVRLWQSDGRTG